MTDPIEILKLIVRLVEREVERDSELTVEELLGSLNREIAFAEARRADDTKPCKHCGHPVAVVLPEVGPVHILASGEASNRGCRAASYDRRKGLGLEGWDETLSREAYAS